MLETKLLKKTSAVSGHVDIVGNAAAKEDAINENNPNTHQSNTPYRHEKGNKRRYKKRMSERMALSSLDQEHRILNETNRDVHEWNSSY